MLFNIKSFLFFGVMFLIELILCVAFPKQENWANSCLTVHVKAKGTREHRSLLICYESEKYGSKQRVQNLTYLKSLIRYITTTPFQTLTFFCVVAFVSI